MGYKFDQRLPSEIHEEFLIAQRESLQDALPAYSELADEEDGEAMLDANFAPPYQAGEDDDYDGPQQGRIRLDASSSTSTTPISTSPPRGADTLTLMSTAHPSRASLLSTTTNTANLEFVRSQDTFDPTSMASSTSTLPADGRRVLLVIYIHGFVGDETSFAAFPAHVHSLLSSRPAVTATHEVHSKVFPKYKTRKNMSVVRDQFSAWLTQRESPRTDIVLVGHSMGGILAAEVALMPAPGGRGGLKHKGIIGTLNLDVPFLGMHPKVIGAGISSLFAGGGDDKVPPPGPYLAGAGVESGSSIGEVGSGGNTPDVAVMPIEPPASPPVEGSGSTTSLFASTTSPSSSSSSLSPAFMQTKASGSSGSLAMPAHNDDFFNPAYANDRRVPTRKAFDNISHFVGKHARSDGLLRAGVSYLSSHLEFGGTMADYKKLDRRYKALRGLEKGPNGTEDGVRFINYFTVCDGRPKKVKPKKEKVKKEKNEKKGKSGKEKDKKGKKVEKGAKTPEVAGDEASTTSEKKAKEAEAGTNAPTEEFEGLQLHDPVPMQSSSDENGKDNDDESESDSDSTPVNSSDEGSFADAHDYLHHDEDNDDDDAASSSSHAPSTDISSMASGTKSPLTPSSSLQASSSLKISEAEDDGVDDTIGLPPLPAEPVPLPAFDASSYAEKDALKLAEKQHARQLKAYTAAVRDYEKVLREREKLVRKRRERRAKEREREKKEAEKKSTKEALDRGKEEKKEAAKREKEKGKEQKDKEKEEKKVKAEEDKRLKSQLKEAEKLEKARLKEEERRVKAEEKRMRDEEKRVKREAAAAGPGPSPSQEQIDSSEDDEDDELEDKEKEAVDEESDSSSASTATPTPTPTPTIAPKPRKLRTFCLTPPKSMHAATGAARRSDWVPVFVAGVDQVGAHCGLFVEGRGHYERFVRDVVERLEGWVVQREYGGGAVVV